MNFFPVPNSLRSSFTLFGQQMMSSINARQKKVALFALGIMSVLTLSFFIYRFCCKPKIKYGPIIDDHDVQDRIIQIEKDLFKIEGFELAKNYKQVNSDFSNKTEKNKQFLFELAKNLGDPSMDFIGLMKNVQNKWQIKALSKGFVENQTTLELVKFWDDKRIEDTFTQFKSLYKNKPQFLEAFDRARNFVQRDLEGKRLKYEADHQFPINEAHWHKLVQTKIKASKSTISWEDFLRISSSRLAIVHTSSLENAENALKNGTKEDALPISQGISMLLDHLFLNNGFGEKSLLDYLDEEDLKEFKLEKERYFFQVDRFISKKVDKILSRFNDQEREILLRKYEEILRDFIFKSAFCQDSSIPYDSKDWKMQWEESIVKSTSFIIVKRNDGNYAPPYGDGPLNYHLGKYGVGGIKQDELKRIVSPLTKEDLAEFQKDILDVTHQVAAIQERAVDKFLSQILSISKQI